MGGAIARYGDTTTTGGLVLAVNEYAVSHGASIALHGDQATCGNCSPGSWPIAGSAEHLRFHGRIAVQHGDLVACPCGKNRVIVTAQDMLYSDGGNTRNSSIVKTVDSMSLIATEDLTDDEEIIEQSFALLIDGITPTLEYSYDLYSEGSLHTKKGSYSNGATENVQGQKNLKLVTWIARDSASKST